MGAGAALGCLLHAGAACPDTFQGAAPTQCFLWSHPGCRRPAAGCGRHTALGPQTGERELSMHEGREAMPSQKLGAVGRDAAPVAVAADRRVYAPQRGNDGSAMSASSRRTAAPLGRITESNKARAHWIDLIRDAR